MKKRHGIAQFKKQLPLLSKVVLEPQIVVWVAVCLGAVSVFFSPHYSCSFLISCIPFIAVYLERNLLGRVLFTPYAMIAFWTSMSTGVGVGLYVWTNGGAFESNLFKMQLITIFGFPISFLSYRFGFGRVPRVIFPDFNPRFRKHIVQPLVWVGVLLLLWRVVQFTSNASTGASDRGMHGIVARDEVFGIWTYFSIFPRFETLSFFFLPLVFKYVKSFLRAVIILLICYILLLAFATGSRGTFIFPFVFFGVGTYFFKTRFLKTFRFIRLDVVAIGSCALILPLLLLMDHFRNTQTFREKRTIDIVGRFSAIGEAFDRIEVMDANAQADNENVRLVSRALIGVNDTIIYEMTPRDIPHAGFDNFEAILYTWAPTFIFRNAPILTDNNPVLWRYLGRVDRNGRTFTLEADLYRRFGWLAIPFGVAFYFYIYGLFCGGVYRFYLRKNALLGCIMILYTFSFFFARPFGTVLGTWWFMLYDTPKHLVALFGLYWVVRKLLGQSVKLGGAYSYIKR